MTSRFRKTLAATGIVALAAGGYFAYNLLAAQGQGALAQAPLNTQIQVPPAFIMAVDDSGSMHFQTQFPGPDGSACWSNGSFFSGPGVLRDSGNNCSTGNVNDYVAYVLPGARSVGRGLPPIPSLGFGRSHQFNPSYFDPGIDYRPWQAYTGAEYADVSVEETPIDPRGSSAPSSPLRGTVRLFENRRQTSEPFRIFSGMVIPSGTVFYRTGNNNLCNVWSNGTNSSEGNTNWYRLTSDRTANATCDIYIEYFPATFYLRTNTPVGDQPAGYLTTSAARPVIAGGCGTGCDLWRYEIKRSNFANDDSFVAMRQNFANWFSYYGSRNRAMIAGMTRSMADVNNMRVGYFTINQHGSYNTTGKRLPMYNLATSGGRQSLYNSMLSLNADGSTFNRQAVFSAGKQFQRDDTDAPVQLACQRNAVMLFTDGFSNGGGPTVGNVDRDMNPPFSDTHSNTLADIATSYYLNNENGRSPLRPDLSAGQVPVPNNCPSDDPRVNCQSNLHINFYGVTLGARGDLFNPDTAQNPYTDASIYNNWPSRQDNNRSTVDDIWHATVNTRGEFINARTPADITAAMRRILSTVSAGASPSGSLAVSGARIGQGSLAVTPQYEVSNEGTDWFSRLVATRVSVNAATGAVDNTAFWEASTRIPAVSSRNVWYANSGAVAKYNANTLTLDNICTKDLELYPGMSRCSADEVRALGANVSRDSARRYLLGDTTLEKRNGGPFRDRTNVLGAIVNSTPVVSAPSDDYGYRALPTLQGGGLSGEGSYGAYLEAKKNRRYMVYVGANDGMFHAFDGGLNAAGVAPASDTQAGRELFGYIPSTAVGHLGNLLFPYDPSKQNDQKFSHRYFVDGPVAVGDARYASQWHTVAVGTSGAGGRSVFALDVSNPGAFGSGSRLWEISDLMPGTEYAAVRANIGYVLGRPVIAPVKDTNGNVAFKAIFGNGYNSASGKAVLFVVELGTGDPKVQMIEAEESGSSIAGTNGLGNIVVVDRWTRDTTNTGAPNNLNAAGSDGFADTVYAADQKGAIWKFDLRAPTPAKQTLPLFTSGESTEGGRTYRQPITGGLLATAGPAGSVMLYFGTGSFSFTTDPGDKTVQSLYAVIDPVRGAPQNSFAPIRPTNLTARTITGTVNGARTISTASAPAGSRGWRLTLPAGERFVGFPSIATGVVFLPTYAPQETATGCSTQGFNWLYGLDAMSGAAAFSAARSGSINGTAYAQGTAGIALDTGGSAPVRDVGVLALPRQSLGTASGTGGAPPDEEEGEGGGEPPAPPSQGCWMAVTVAGAATSYLPYPCGRQSWRQIE